MAFNTNVGKQQFSATAGQTDFDFNFAIFNDTDLRVYLTPSGNVADDTADILTLSSDYSVSINGTLGGTVELASGASLNDTVTIVRSLPLSRTTDYVTNGDLYADTLDADQDYQTYLAVDQNVRWERSLVLPESYSGEVFTLPAPDPFKMFRWNSTGEYIENIDPTSILDTVNGIIVENVTDLINIDVSVHKTAIVRDINRGGIFVWSESGTANGNTVFEGSSGYWSKHKKDALISETSTSTDYSNFRVDRNANHVGGATGFVNSAIRVNHTVSEDVTNFEWGITSVMNNLSTAGENVAIYGQGNKLSSGITWAGVFEARDFTHIPNPTSGLVGIEVDTFGNGTDSNNQRIGIDISIGKDDQSGTIMETGYGVRIGATNGNISAGRVKRAFALGVIEFDIGLDLAEGTQSANGVGIRMAVGQKLSFAATNDRTIQYNSGALIYQVSNINKWVCFDNGSTDQTGVLKINSTQVLTSRRTGYTTAMTGTANRASSYDTSTITLVQLAERVKALQDDLSIHGLIGA